MNAMQDHLSATFLALADPTRRAILARLGKQRLRVTQLAAPFAISLAAVSKHVRALEQARLVTRDVVGREHWIAVKPGGLNAAQDWIERHQKFWAARLDALQELVEAMPHEMRARRRGAGRRRG